MQSSFREILEEKLKSPLEKPVSPEGKSQFSDPFALSFLMGSIPQFRYQNKTYSPNLSNTSTKENIQDEVNEPSQKFKSENFDSKHNASDTSINAEPQDHSPAESTYKVANLKVEAVAAIYVLKGLGANLNDEFTFSELKKQYRSLLLRYHPDHSNNSNIEPFYDLMQAYESLVSELGDI